MATISHGRLPARWSSLILRDAVPARAPAHHIGMRCATLCVAGDRHARDCDRRSPGQFPLREPSRRIPRSNLQSTQKRRYQSWWREEGLAKRPNGRQDREKRRAARASTSGALTYGCHMAILAEPWPRDLDPSRVPFRQRTITVLRGMGLWDDMTRIDVLSVDDVAGYWVTGPVTVNDVISSGNEAIAWHHSEAARLIEEVNDVDWTRQVWRRDLRFRDLLPDVDATVHDIAISGRHSDQRYLLKTLPRLQERLDAFATESRDEALIRYVSTNTGQSWRRTTRLLQRLGLLEPTITGSEAGRQLGVSPQRIYQLVGQVRHRIEQVQPPKGAAPWLPQDPAAVPSILETPSMET